MIPDFSWNPGFFWKFERQKKIYIGETQTSNSTKRNIMESQYNFYKVPNLPTRKILSYLDFESLKNCRIVYKTLYDILQDKYLWKKILIEKRVDLVQAPDLHVYSIYFQETDALFELADDHKNHSDIWEPAFGCLTCRNIMKEKVVAAKNSWLCLIDQVIDGDSVVDMIAMIPKISYFSLFGCLQTPKLVEENLHQEYYRLFKLIWKFQSCFQLHLENFLRCAILSKNVLMVKFLLPNVENVDYIHKHSEDCFLIMAASTGSLEVFRLITEWVRQRKGETFLQNIFFALRSNI